MSFDRGCVLPDHHDNDALHIFVFENEGDRPFVSVHTFYEDEFQLTFSR